MKVEYYILDPSGNITALVTSAVQSEHRKSVADRIMSRNKSVEQVGFVDLSGEDIKLNMAGDEFCGNAVISAAALGCYLSGAKGKTKLAVNVLPLGISVPVAVLSDSGGYSCEADIMLPEKSGECEFAVFGREYKFPYVSFPGINHIVADETLSQSAAEAAIKKLAADMPAKAVGIMIYNRDKNSLIPIVYVPGADTLFVEKSCASGSCAVAYTQGGDGIIDIYQPGGIIKAQRTKGGIKLFNTVKIMELCLEEI